MLSASPHSPFGLGVLLALVSACAFGLSGPIARGLLDNGWSAGAAVTARIAIGALILLGPGLYAVRGRWSLLADARTIGALAAYGALAVALPQLCYFCAVTTLQVAVALLVEYAAPVAVVAWMWLRHRQRPTALTVVGAAAAAAGLALVLQVFGSVSLDAVGIAWALGAMFGAASYFVLSGNSATTLPGITMAAGGLTCAAVILAVAGAVGVLPMHASAADAALADHTVPWLAPVAVLGVVTAAVAYATGIAAIRLLRPRLASFIGLSEVLAATVAAWLLLGEVPTAVQLVGGVLIVLGVVVVRLGESGAETTTPRSERSERGVEQV